MHTRKGISPLAIVLILAVLLGGGYLALRKPAVVYKGVSDLTTPANWQTYRNEQYGFEFKYPTGIFTLLPITQLLPPAPYHDGYTGVKLISPSNVSKLGTRECYYGEMGGPSMCTVGKEQGINFVAVDKAVRDLTMSLTSPPATQVVVAGKPSTKWSIGAEGDGVDYYFVPLSPNRTLVISRQYVNEGLPSGFPSQELFNQILSTFKFTK